MNKVAKRYFIVVGVVIGVIIAAFAFKMYQGIVKSNEVTVWMIEHIDDVERIEAECGVEFAIYLGLNDSGFMIAHPVSEKSETEAIKRLHALDCPYTIKAFSDE